VACLKNEANPDNYKRFHNFICDECVKKATKEAKKNRKKLQIIKALYSGDYDNLTAKEFRESMEKWLG